MRQPTILRALTLAFLGFALVAASGPTASNTEKTNTIKKWVEEMKKSPKGPFQRIRWFCKDGTVLPPQPYACKDHGGGGPARRMERAHQEAMRAGGYEIGNVLADRQPESPSTGKDPNVKLLLKQILLERFLDGMGQRLDLPPGA